MLQTENARARFGAGMISATIPGALLIMTLPASAPMKRKMIIVIIDLATATGIIMTLKMRRLITVMGFLPYISLRGAMTTDPSARPKR